MTSMGLQVEILLIFSIYRFALKSVPCTRNSKPKKSIKRKYLNSNLCEERERKQERPSALPAGNEVTVAVLDCRMNGLPAYTVLVM